MSNSKPTRTIDSVERRSGRTYWKRIGIAFTSSDGSENLVFDSFPPDPQTAIQIRESEPKDEDDEVAR